MIVYYQCLNLVIKRNNAIKTRRKRDKKKENVKKEKIRK